MSASVSDDVLEVRDLSVEVDGSRLVEDVSFTLGAGEVMALLGPSGCGKSTLLRAMTGLMPLARGSVHLGGRDLTRVPTHRRGLALMFQDGQLFGNRTVAGNIAYPLRIRHLGRREIAGEVSRLLSLVGLDGFAERRAADLSGGERQRVALARALAVNPRVVLLDEPLSALDRQLRDRLAGDLREILTAAGVSAVFVTHDHEEAFTVADSMALMREGRLVQRGTLSQVWRAPVDATAALFLGYAEVLDPARAAALLSLAGLRPRQGWLALRRSALRVTPVGGLLATVVSVRPTPDLVRLTAAVPGVGTLSVVADRDTRIAPSQEVSLELDLERCAWVGEDHTPDGAQA